MMLSNRVVCFVFVVIVWGHHGVMRLHAQGDDLHRITDFSEGLQVLYDFDDIRANQILDRSGKLPPMDLQIEDMTQVQLRDGVLSVLGSTVIASQRPAKRVVNAVQKSGAITVEVWLRSHSSNQDGPARIVTLSKDARERNFTIGQEGDSIQVRLRTSKTSHNGIPALQSRSRSINEALTHVVYARGRSGNAKIFINGRLDRQQLVAGELENWDEQYRLALGNEVSGGRPWLGDLHRVAVYSREWTLGDVQARFARGIDDDGAFSKSVASKKRADFFETEVAPLLSTHCLECHDSATHKGGLDLSRRAAAFKGGDSGKVLFAGNAAKSPLWRSVDSDQMPHDRPLLSDSQKQVLKQWIDDGATWSVEFVDPAIYRHQRKAGNWVRRLTLAEYVATVNAIFGINVAHEAEKLLPEDKRADGFRNTAYNLTVDLKHVQAYAQMAGMVVDRVDVASFAKRFGKSRKLTDKNMRPLIADIGKRVLRSPLTGQEMALYRGISTTVASAGGDFDEAVGMILESMLQSPKFLYRIENQRGDGSRWPVSDYELASRLSYLICGTPPDEELLKAAEQGVLGDPDQVRRQVKRLLQSEDAKNQSRQFIVQWLNLDRLASMRPDNQRFPAWTDALAADMRQETIDVFMELVWKQNKPLSSLLNAQFTYLTPELAEHYGIPPRGPGRQRYDVANIPSRGGLLTQASVLTIGGDDASMVARGLFVLSDLLYSEVGDPPPGLDVTPVPTSPGKSHRTIATTRVQSEACGGCHARFEPLAFGLERYDGIGAFHVQDEFGNELRQDGEILFPGDAKPVAYQTSAEMMNLLANSDRVKECLTRKVSQFLLGRPLDMNDAASLRRIHADSQKSGGTYQSLVMAIVLSDLVRTAPTEPEP